MNSGVGRSAAEIARSIRAREISCEKVVEAHLEHIAAVNPSLNAVVQLCPDRARAEARAADALLARGGEGGEVPPLLGVPVTIKDNLDTAGMISTGGTQGRSAFVPAHDATVVERLRRAGAIVLGKTNTPELTMAYETDNLVHGRTNHPLNSTLSCGGSSGGAAAILAAGGSALDIGSDTGGSIRVPAHCCGIAGLKPTAGRVPKGGHILPIGGLVDAMTQLGPMARCIDDLEMALSVIAGPDWRDPTAVPVPMREPGEVSMRGLRVAIYTRNGIMEPSPVIADVVRRTAGVLAGAGAIIEEALPPGIEQSFDFTLALWTADGGAYFKRVLERAGTRELHPFMQGVLETCRRGARSAGELGAVVEQWHGFRSELLRFMENHDLLLSPALPFTAFPHGASFDDAHFPGFSYTMLHNLTGWPALVMRAGTSPEGLPIGVQLAAGPWREHVALAAGRFLENHFAGLKPPVMAALSR